MALTVAGSDSGGGAGIQADLKTFAACGVFGTSAITAVTAQNTTGVSDVVALEPEVVAAQIKAVLADLGPGAAKTGMLATAAIVTTVAAMATRGELPALVVDPVLVSTSGHILLDEGGVAAYRDHLLPQALVATPNLREAAVLTGRDVRQLGDEDAMVEAGRELQALGPRYVVVKGGHLGGPLAPDVVLGPTGVDIMAQPRVATRNDHGTGCSLSAAIAASLARGLEPMAAIAGAKRYVHQALVGAADWSLGEGHGPLDHFGWGSSDPGGHKDHDCLSHHD